jgi:hypothetical protein
MSYQELWARLSPLLAAEREEYERYLTAPYF